MNLEQCKGVYCVDLGESFQTHINLQKFVSIQPRTSPPKNAKDLQNFANSATAQAPGHVAVAIYGRGALAAGMRPPPAAVLRPGNAARGRTLHRLDEALRSIFRNFANFGGLVLGCIEADFLQVNTSS